MNKRQKVIILMIIMMFSFISFIRLPSTDIPTVAAETKLTSAAGGVGEHYYQRHSWYAKGRWWTFYSDGTNAVFNSSVNGETGWVDGTIDIDCEHTFRIDVWYDSANETFSFVWIDYSEGKVYFRMGDPQTDGTIDWNYANPQIASGAVAVSVEPTVTLDSEGYPWVTWEHQEFADAQPVHLYTWRSIYNNGTFSATGDPTVITSGTNQGREGKLLPLLNRDMMAVYCKQLHSVEADSQLYYKIYDNDSDTWGSEGTITSYNITDGYAWSWSEQDGSIYIGFNNASNNYGGFAKYDGSTWTDEVAVSSAIVNAPSLVRRENGDFWYIWGDNTKNIKMMYYNDTSDSFTTDKNIATLNVYSGGETVVERPSTIYPEVGFLYYGSDLYFELIDLASYSVVIEDSYDCEDDKWVFTREDYYTFNMTFSHDLDESFVDTLTIAFQEGSGDWINATYERSTDEFNLDSGEGYVYLSGGDYYSSGFDFTVEFNFYFRDTLGDALDVDIHCWGDDSDGNTPGWQEAETDYFNIYDEGGYSDLLTSGTAGKLDGGEVGEDELWQDQANSDGGSELYTGSGDWELDISIYYCDHDGGDWVEGWRLNLKMDSGDKGPDDYWTLINSTWYQKDTAIKDDTWYAYIEAEPLARIRIYVDLWFNKEDASQLSGGRVNSMFHGIENTGWLWFSTWAPMMGNVTQSMYFEN